MTFTNMEYAGAVAEDSMEGIIPRAAFIEAIEPFYPKSSAPGWQQIRTGVVQPGRRGASIYDSYAMRKFMKLDW
jgi:hypothetical protein